MSIKTIKKKLSTLPYKKKNVLASAL